MGDEPTEYTIGAFAALTGLTEKALRIYDARGLLVPAYVDPDSGYRYYTRDQVDAGRLIATLRAIEMPLDAVAEVAASSPADRPELVGRYWYRVERRLDDHRETVRRLRQMAEREEHDMSHADAAVAAGRTEGAFAAIARLGTVEDDGEAAEAYVAAMRRAHWDHHDAPLAVAIAYAGVGRLLAAAGSSDAADAYALSSTAKGLTYDVASFTWPGWVEPGIELGPTETAAGLAAARTNLAMAVELEKGDLPVSRAHWMLGAHLLTAGEHGGAAEQFAAAEQAAAAAGAAPEIGLARSFRELAGVAGGEATAASRLADELAALGGLEHGADFVAQVTTARRVLGC